MGIEREILGDLDEAAEAAADARALADTEPDRWVSHEEVAKWLKTWGTPDYYPMPREWLE